MKTLLLLRHAKSSWRENSQSDFDRPLNERGKEDAPRVGRLLREKGLRPDLVLSSSAKRASKTATKAIEASGYDVELKLLDELYLAVPATYIRQIKLLSDVFSCAMIVGHNPGLEELFAELSGQHVQLPTSALAHIELPIIHWSDVASDGSARVALLWRPADDE